MGPADDRLYVADCFQDFFKERRLRPVRIALGRRFCNPNFKAELECMAKNACHLCHTLDTPCSCRGRFSRAMLPDMTLQFRLTPARLAEFSQRYPALDLVHVDGRRYHLPPHRLLAFLEAGHRPSVEGMNVLAQAEVRHLDFPRASRDFEHKQDSHDAFAKGIFEILRLEVAGLGSLAVSCQLQNALLRRWGKTAPPCEDLKKQLLEAEDSGDDDRPRARRRRRPREHDKHPSLAAGLRGYGGSHGKSFVAGSKGTHVNLQSTYPGEGRPTVEIGPRYAATVTVRARCSGEMDLLERGRRGPVYGGLKYVVLSCGKWRGAFDVQGGADFEEELRDLVGKEVAPQLVALYQCGGDYVTTAERSELLEQAAAYLRSEGGRGEGPEAAFGTWMRARYPRPRAATFVVEIGRPVQTGDVLFLVRHPVNGPMLSMRVVVNQRRHDLCIGSCGLICLWVEGDYDGDDVKLVPAESAERTDALAAFDLSELLFAADGRPVLKLSGAAPRSWSVALLGGDMAPPLEGVGCRAQLFPGVGELRVRREAVDFSHCGLLRADLVRPELFLDADFEVLLEGRWICPAHVLAAPQAFSCGQRAFASLVSDDGSLPVERAAPPEPQLAAALLPLYRGPVRVLRLRNSVLDDMAVREQISLQLAFHSLNYGQRKVSALHAPEEGLDRGAVMLRALEKPPTSFREAVLSCSWRPEPKQMAAMLWSSLPSLRREERAALRSWLPHPDRWSRALTLPLPIRAAQALRRFLRCPPLPFESDASSSQLLAACHLSLLLRVKISGSKVTYTELTAAEAAAEAAAGAAAGTAAGAAAGAAGAAAETAAGAAAGAATEEATVSRTLRRWEILCQGLRPRPLCCPAAERLVELHAAYPDRRPQAEVINGLEHLAQHWVNLLLPAVEARHVYPYDDEAARKCLQALLAFEKRVIEGHLVDGERCAAKARAELTLLLKDASRAISLATIRGLPDKLEALHQALSREVPDATREMRAILDAVPRLYRCRSPSVRCSRLVAARNAAYSKENAAETGMAPVAGLPGLRPTLSCALHEEGALSPALMGSGYSANYDFVLQQQSHFANKDGKTPLSNLAAIRSTNSSTCSTLRLDRGRVYGAPVDERLCLREMPDGGLCGERCRRDFLGLSCRHCGFLRESPKRKLILADAPELALDPRCRARMPEPSGLHLLRGSALFTLAQASVCSADGDVLTRLPPNVQPADLAGLEFIFPECLRADPGDAGPWLLGPGQYLLVRVVSLPEAPAPRQVRVYDEEDDLKQALESLPVQAELPEAEEDGGEEANVAGVEESLVCCLVEKPVQALGNPTMRLQNLRRDLSEELAQLRAAEAEARQTEPTRRADLPQEPLSLEKSEPLAFSFDLRFDWGAPEAVVLQEYGSSRRESCRRCSRPSRLRALRRGDAVLLTTLCHTCVQPEERSSDASWITIRADDPRFGMELYRYLAELRSWGFAVRLAPGRRLRFDGSLEECMSLASAWRVKRQGEEKSLPATVLQRHYPDELTHQLTTQDGRVGTVKRSHAQAFRVGDFQRLRRAPRPEIVDGFRDVIAI